MLKQNYQWFGVKKNYREKRCKKKFGFARCSEHGSRICLVYFYLGARVQFGWRVGIEFSAGAQEKLGPAVFTMYSMFEDEFSLEIY